MTEEKHCNRDEKVGWKAKFSLMGLLLISALGIGTVATGEYSEITYLDEDKYAKNVNKVANFSSMIGEGYYSKTRQFINAEQPILSYTQRIFFHSFPDNSGLAASIVSVSQAYPEKTVFIQLKLGLPCNNGTHPTRTVSIDIDNVASPITDWRLATYSDGEVGEAFGCTLATRHFSTTVR